MRNKFLNWLPVFLWATLIFYLSSQSGLKSGLPWPYDFILRKGAHITEFAVLFLLLLRAMLAAGFQNKKALILSALFAIFYAALDEWHQTFVFGRDGNIKDVGIDTLGILAISLWLSRRSWKKY